MINNQLNLISMPKGIDFTAHKTVRIAVSGDIKLNKLEVSIIDTNEFQRLRYIKQLGTTYKIYPTALHTRFDHSLGTFAMADNMVRLIRSNKHNSELEKKITEEQEQIIRLYALLHDIGHIPFGHTLEDEFCIFPRHDEDNERIEYFLGEESTIGKKIIDCLGQKLYQRFMRVCNYNEGDKFKKLDEDMFIYDIVNNTVCADLLDYLRRDSYFCNVDLNMDYRFLNYLYLHPDKNTKRLAIRLWKKGKPTPRMDILSELTRLLDNRYLLAERIYFHHAKLITGAMIAAAVYRAQIEGKIDIKTLYKIGDDRLLEKLENLNGCKQVNDIIKCYKERVLWEDLYSKDRSSVIAEQKIMGELDLWDIIKGRWWENPRTRKEDEDKISNLFRMEPGDFLIYCPNPKMGMKLAKMKVFYNGKLRPLCECKDDPIVERRLKITLDSHENLWNLKTFINPKHSDKKDSLYEACENLFTFDNKRKSHYEKNLYKIVIKDVIEEKRLNDNLSAHECEERENIALDNILKASAGLKEREQIERIIINAFKR
jgi:HD superfamily phosphohydrolase